MIILKNCKWIRDVCFLIIIQLKHSFLLHNNQKCFFRLLVSNSGLIWISHTTVIQNNKACICQLCQVNWSYSYTCVKYIWQHALTKLLNWWQVYYETSWLFKKKKFWVHIVFDMKSMWCSIIRTCIISTMSHWITWLWIMKYNQEHSIGRSHWTIWQWIMNQMLYLKKETTCSFIMYWMHYTQAVQLSQFGIVLH